jgi:hypothetical protein
MIWYALGRRTGPAVFKKNRGEVSERLIELVSKTSVPLGVPRVRIPPSPHYSFLIKRIFISSFIWVVADLAVKSGYSLEVA